MDGSEAKQRNPPCQPAIRWKSTAIPTQAKTQSPFAPQKNLPVTGSPALTLDF
jgi:hypothetical protein